MLLILVLVTRPQSATLQTSTTNNNPVPSTQYPVHSYSYSMHTTCFIRPSTNKSVMVSATMRDERLSVSVTNRKSTKTRRPINHDCWRENGTLPKHIPILKAHNSIIKCPTILPTTTTATKSGRTKEQDDSDE